MGKTLADAYRAVGSARTFQWPRRGVPHALEESNHPESPR